MSSPARWPWFALAFVLYTAVFLYRSSYVIDGERYFFLFDDAMISMRYARHWAEGFGPVWNPGERVEGFTNPLWTLYMAAWHLLPIPASKMSLPIQLTGALLGLANLLLSLRLARRVTGEAWTVLPVGVLLLLYYPLNSWFFLGMEVSALTLLVTGAVSLALGGLQTWRQALGLYALLGLGTWIRIDAAVPLLAIAGYGVLFDRGGRRLHAVGAALALAFFLGAQFWLRHAYYGEWLPNTYFLKMEGVAASLRLARGALVLLNFLVDAGLLLFPIAALYGLRRPEARLCAWVFAGQAAYSVYVGGDAWEWRHGSNRFLSVAFPLFVILLVGGLSRLRQWAEEAPPARAAWARVVAAALVAGVVAGGLVAQLPGGAGVLVAGVVAGGLIWHGARRGLAGAWWGWAGVLGALCNLNGSVQVIDETHPARQWLLLAPRAATRDLATLIAEGNALRAISTPDAVFAVTWAGVLPYFTGHPTIDLLGKTDPVIAHQEAKLAPLLKDPAVPLAMAFVPGHNKWDYGRSVGALRPDLLLQVWPGTATIPPEEAPPADLLPYLGEYQAILLPQGKIFARRGSPHIRWDLVKAAD